MKKLLLIILSIFCLFFSNFAFADEVSTETSTEKTQLDKKIEKQIEENNKLIRQRLEDTIEKKLNFIEISERYKALDEKAKINFYEVLLTLVKQKLEITKKEREIEIYEIFIEKVSIRLNKLYWTNVEDEEIIIELFNIK